MKFNEDVVWIINHLAEDGPSREFCLSPHLTNSSCPTIWMEGIHSRR